MECSCNDYTLVEPRATAWNDEVKFEFGRKKEPVSRLWCAVYVVKHGVGIALRPLIYIIDMIVSIGQSLFSVFRCDFIAARLNAKTAGNEFLCIFISIGGEVFKTMQALIGIFYPEAYFKPTEDAYDRRGESGGHSHGGGGPASRSGMSNGWTRLIPMHLTVAGEFVYSYSRFSSPIEQLGLVSSIKGRSWCVVNLVGHAFGVVLRPLAYLALTIRDLYCAIQVTFRDGGDPGFNLRLAGKRFLAVFIAPVSQTIKIVSAACGIIHPGAYYNTIQGRSLQHAEPIANAN